MKPRFKTLHKVTLLGNHSRDQAIAFAPTEIHAMELARERWDAAYPGIEPTQISMRCLIDVGWAVK